MAAVIAQPPPLRELSDTDLEAALDAHARWCADASGAGHARGDLSRTNLYGRDLSGRNLEGVNLAGANLQEARLAEARLGGASLVGCAAALADFSKADLTRADLAGGRFQRATFTGATTRGASLVGGHFDDSVGFEIDGNRAAGADFQGSDEPWTRLKDKFSGLHLGLNLLFFLLFFLPYLGRALGLIVASEVMARFGDLQGASPLAAVAGIEIRQVSLLWVLIGGEQSHWMLGRYGWCLSVILILFALSRVAATYWTALLAERELKQERAPARSVYRRLLPLERLADVLQFASWFAFALNLVQWWRLTVPILSP